MSTRRTLRAWGECIDCGYPGMLEYTEVDGEDYGDPESFGVMMLLRCPSCESSEHTLVAMEYYRELLAIERSGQEDE